MDFIGRYGMREVLFPFCMEGVNRTKFMQDAENTMKQPTWGLRQGDGVCVIFYDNNSDPLVGLNRYGRL